MIFKYLPISLQVSTYPFTDKNSNYYTKLDRNNNAFHINGFLIYSLKNMSQTFIWNEMDLQSISPKTRIHSSRMRTTHT